MFNRFLHYTPTGTEVNVCRKCGSSDIKYFKRIHIGKIVKQYHYGIHCLNCGKSYKVERTKFIYEQVKDIKWEYSKATNKRLKQQLRSRLIQAAIFP